MPPWPQGAGYRRLRQPSGAEVNSPGRHKVLWFLGRAVDGHLVVQKLQERVLHRLWHVLHSG